MTMRRLSILATFTTGATLVWLVLTHTVIPDWQLLGIATVLMASAVGRATE